MPKIALLTGGGDAPGLNGILESVSRTLLRSGVELVGILDGFEGVFAKKIRPIRLEDVEGIHQNAGTFLGTSNRSKVDGREKEFLKNFESLGVEGVIVAGGDGTFAALSHVSDSIRVIGVPKTIDNDLSGTEITFGFDTACSVVAESIDALRATANAHRRVMLVETMGRTAGWIALGGGMASYADAILLPERPFELEAFLKFIESQKNTHKRGLCISVAEGAHPVGEARHVAFRVEGSPEAERLGGIAEWLARTIEKRVGWESRHVVLGHLQRAAHPSTTDRFLTLAMGTKAAELALKKAWGQAVVYTEGQVREAPLKVLQGPPRLVSSDHRWVQMAQAVGIWL